MRVEYQAILDDFEAEITAIAELADATRIGSQFSSRARISLANSLTLVLASTFEEYVRQLVKAAWSERLKVVDDASKLPPKLRSKLWRSTLERAARKPFGDVDSQSWLARDRLQNLMKFCLDGDLSVPIDDEISHNERNMRPDQISDLFSKIGIRNIFVTGCALEEAIEYFDCQNADQASENLRAALEDFFIRRNNVAHAIVFGSSDGADTIHQDIDICKLTAKALANGAELFVEPKHALESERCKSS
jgi:hypothetical protein